jgi:hypothetical protein
VCLALCVVCVWKQEDCTSDASPKIAIDVSSVTTERVEKYVGMRAFGFGADLFPFVGRHEARAMRLVCQLMNVAVDRRSWPVHALVISKTLKLV